MICGLARGRPLSHRWSLPFSFLPHTWRTLRTLRGTFFGPPPALQPLGAENIFPIVGNPPPADMEKGGKMLRFPVIPHAGTSSHGDTGAQGVLDMENH